MSQFVTHLSIVSLFVCDYDDISGLVALELQRKQQCHWRNKIYKKKVLTAAAKPSDSSLFASFPLRTWRSLSILEIF